MSRHYKAGRMAILPGVETTFTFKPALLTARMRNAVKRMVSSRVLEGGWASKSKSIATELLRHYDVPSTSTHFRSRGIVELPPSLDVDCRNRLLTLCQADFTSMALSDNWPSTEYLQTTLANNKQALFNLSPKYISFFDRDYQRKAADIIRKYNQRHADYHQEQVDACLRMLDDPHAHITMSLSDL